MTDTTISIADSTGTAKLLKAVVNTDSSLSFYHTVADAGGVALRPAAAKATGTLTATGVGTQTGIVMRGDLNVTLTGPFVATVVVERSFDNGTTWAPLTALGNAIAFTAPATEIFSEPEAAVKYRVNCTCFTSGTITFCISQ